MMVSSEGACAARYRAYRQQECGLNNIQLAHGGGSGRAMQPVINSRLFMEARSPWLAEQERSGASGLAQR